MSGNETLIVIGIIAVFGAFAATIAWADIYTRDTRAHWREPDNGNKKSG